MRGGSVPVLASNAEGAETAAASQSTQPHIVQPPLRERPLTEQDIVGLKYFDELLPLFQRLREDGCQRDKAGNHARHYDQ